MRNVSEYFGKTDEETRNELIAMLIHNGIAPKDITFREGLIYYNNIKDLLEQDAAVINKGLAGEQ